MFKDRTEYRYFLTLVNELQTYARDLPAMEWGFLGRLTRIKSRSLLDVAFARDVEEADGRNYRATSALSDEMACTQENMRMRDVKELERARVSLWNEMDEISARARRVERRFRALDVMWEDAHSFSS
ncbi:hypothetical protein A2U01_0006620 [Trifolium medium]|uniref:Uncharacterized protein n=1 Tax=Trifolium medium TaxID=97028 RepID=A0A392ME58_9FABA|nr:hypothetical protein [Trifolium medium]